MTEKATIYALGEQHIAAAVDVLCQSFYDYPVMRYIIDDGEDYDQNLQLLMHFFAIARLLRGETILGCEGHDRPEGVALISRPDHVVRSAQLSELREKVWQALGSEARNRYESLGSVWSQFTVEEPHLHLNMVGVRPQAQGKGVGRKLIEAVHQMSHDDPDSTGITLTTEDPANVSLYQHLGYKLLGQAQAAPALGTWVFFRADR